MNKKSSIDKFGQIPLIPDESLGIKATRRHYIFTLLTLIGVVAIFLAAIFFRHD